MKSDQATEPTYMHRNIQITYDERNNYWVFTLRGKERIAQSLKQAKEIIDRPPPKEKDDSFTPIPGYFMPYIGCEIEEVKITSLAHDGASWRGPQAWVVGADRRRKKVQRKDLYPKSDSNDAVIAEIRKLQAEKEELEDKIEKAGDRLKELTD